MLRPGMNLNWPNTSGAVSARGLSDILMKLAKSEGRGKDLLINSKCTVYDISRAYMQLISDDMQATADKEKGRP